MCLVVCHTPWETQLWGEGFFRSFSLSFSLNLSLFSPIIILSSPPHFFPPLLFLSLLYFPSLSRSAFPYFSPFSLLSHLSLSLSSLSLSLRSTIFRESTISGTANHFAAGKSSRYPTPPSPPVPPSSPRSSSLSLEWRLLFKIFAGWWRMEEERK